MSRSLTQQSQNERQVPGSHNQATTNKTPLNAEDNVMILGEKEWEDLFGNSMEITSFNGFSCESSNEDDKERQTWTKTLNTTVMECYFLSRPVDEEGKPVRGYKRRCIISGRNDMSQK